MRLKNWPALGDAAIREAATWPLCEFGCCNFVGHVATAITGVDKRSLFPVYKTAEEAAAILAEHGGLVGLLTKAFGEPIPVKRAQRFDVVLAEVDGELICGICRGVYVVVLSRDGGITTRPISCARLAWRVE